MIYAHTDADGNLTITIRESRPLQAKQFLNLGGSISGRGTAEAIIDGQRVRFVIINESASSQAEHTPID